MKEPTMANNPNWNRIPAELRERAQWCITPAVGTDKAPRATSGAHASSTDPSTWGSFAAACNVAAERDWQIGYMFSADDPFACIDLDVCNEESQRRKGQPIDPAKWSTPADFERFEKIVAYLDSYTERSVNGHGLHIIVQGNIGPGLKRGDVEVYSQERFLIFTGDAIAEKPVHDRQQVLHQMVSDMRGAHAAVESIADEPEAESDQTILERATRAANAEKFNALCKGEWKPLGYPSQSEADAALLSILAFWSKNNAQVRRIFRMTELGKREKAKRDDYLNRTLAPIRARQAQEHQRTQALVASQPAMQAAIDDMIAKARIVTDDSGGEEAFVPPTLELGDMFKELVYVGTSGSHIAFRDRPWISLPIVDMRRFLSHNKTEVETESGKTVEMPAFDLWVNSGKRESVFGITFDPSQGPLCRSSIDGVKIESLNLWRRRPYWPIDNAEQRALRFLEHVEYLMPVQAEREHFLDWCAHTEQRPGELPHHHFLMITPTQGIGRNSLFKILSRVFEGYTALDFDLMQCMDTGYNNRMSRKLLIVVNEIQEGGGRWKKAQLLKSMVTDETRLINPKYGHQRVEKNCARWVLLSNHEDAIPLDDTDRRWCVIRNPDEPQSADYYRRLNALADDELFIASVREYLRQRNISKFSPGARGWMNEAKQAVIAATRSIEIERAQELVATYPRDVIAHEHLFTAIYGTPPDNENRETSQRWRTLRGFASKAGIEPLKEFMWNRTRYKAWAVRNTQAWKQADGSAVARGLGLM